jgi:hypothetical protein
MKLLKALIILTVCSLLSGCLYANVRAPLDTNVDQTRLGAKVGKASAQSILWLVATGDASVEAAARDGGLTTINHLDVEREVVLFGLFAKTTTIAYGD